MLADHLAAHGVKTEHISDWTNTGDLTAVEALFASLDTQDADLIVAGAFGHSRLYEGLFGGVTMDLMHQQSLPVLMSHWRTARKSERAAANSCCAAAIRQDRAAKRGSNEGCSPDRCLRALLPALLYQPFTRRIAPACPGH